ncbi:MAG: DNA methyltransferase, partial [Candidatus Hermodarchaeota archaeon]|nr:DNA methyltransferase [Candidatus Hermodarchaeota archaeon]
EKLKDPEFRKIEGFPIGSDQDILALSDPPYYTACPNPFIGDFIKHYGKPHDPNVPYSKEPFAADVSEGKIGALYNAHSYHTKVPYLAIQHFIDHFTSPGDLILDGFAGTGMTGVATLSSNKYRRSILIDLCPAATFISNLYNSKTDPEEFSRAANKIIKTIESELKSLYITKDPQRGTEGIIESVIWSTVLICPSCAEESPFWEISKTDAGFNCPKCGATSSRNELEYSIESFLDPFSNNVRQRNKKIPIQITYKVGTKRHTKQADLHDYQVLEKAYKQDFNCWFPQIAMLGKGASWGDTYRAGYHKGYEFAYDFYFPRTLLALAKLRENAFNAPRHLRTHLLGLLTSVAFAATHLYKYRTKGGGQPAGNNLYIPALIKEQNIFSALRRKLKDLVAAEKAKKGWALFNVTSTGSSTNLPFIPNCCIDYIFVDPPFGANIKYSESNFLWEAWLNVRTNQQPEAIVNQTQQKALTDYQELMTSCFSEFFRALKPGRWMTVEFHNSQNSVWTSIQEALGHAGFVVADVRTLDKKQGTFKQVTSA